MTSPDSSPGADPAKPASRVLLLGLDGASWALLDPLIGTGHLPGISGLIEQGVRGVLRSTIPPVTASAWSSLYTGRSPGKHGVFDFRKRMRSESTKREWITHADIRGPKVWEIAASQGKSVGLTNLPLTFPPSPVNGYVIAGMPVPPTRDEIGLPEGLVNEIVRETGEYVSDVDLLRGESPDVGDPETCFEFVNQVERALEARLKAQSYLMKAYPKDLTACVLVTPDRLGHLFWKVLVPDSSSVPLENWEEELRERMVGVLKKMDQAVAAFAGMMSPADLIVVVSDHGFGPLDEILKLNLLLSEKGYLKFVPGAEGGLRRKIGRVLPEAVKQPIRTALETLGGGSRSGKRKGKEFDPYALIDWSETRAYSGGSVEQGVFLNVVGREPHGTVERGGEYHRVRDRLIADLRGAIHPVKGDPLFDWVEPRESVYSGECLEHAPDVMFSLRGYRAVVGEDAEPPMMGPWSQPRAGFHRREGILILKGPMIRGGAHIGEAGIEDMAPTLLACWGLAADEGMDGGIVQGAIGEGFLEANPPRRERFSEAQTEASRPSGEDEDEMGDLLKGLGYLN